MYERDHQNVHSTANKFPFKKVESGGPKKLKDISYLSLNVEIAIFETIKVNRGGQ